MKKITPKKRFWPWLLVDLVILLVVGLWWVSRAHAPAGIGLELTSDMSQVQAGQTVELRYHVLNDEGEVEKDFELSHEKLMHLVVVRDDLTQFQHLHPELNKETGEWSVDLSFAEPGRYELFADFVPEHLPQTVLSFSVTVDGELQTVPLELTTETTQTVGPYTVTSSFPESVSTGEAVNYSFEVTQDGKKVTLEDYLGAKGHSVLLLEGAADYLHTHPNGESLSFQTLFEKPGRYKAFTQFQVAGQLYTVERVFDVSAGDQDPGASSSEVHDM